CRGGDRGRRVVRVDDDVLLAADARGAADGRQSECRVVGGGVLDRAAGERERVRGDVVEVGAVLPAGGRVGKGECRGAATGAVAGGAAAVEGEGRRAGDGDVLAEGDRDRNRCRQRVGAIRFGRGDVGDGRCGGVDD